MPYEKIGKPQLPGDAHNTVGVSWSGSMPFVNITVEDRNTPFNWGMVYPPGDPNRHAGFDESAPFTGFWYQMDREEVNRLIRVLRRARDQAFGRDE